VSNPSNSPYFSSNRFSFNSDNHPSPNYNNNNNRGGYHKNNSFQSSYNQSQNNNNNNDSNQRNNFRFKNQRQNSQQQQQNNGGISLYVKANNVTEELLRNIFNANVSNAKVLSIDIKTNFAFVTVDSTESANNAILELNGNITF
jgi:hypothetical protein